MRKKQFPHLSFRNFFGFWAKFFSDFRPKNFKKMWKLTFECPEEQFMALYLFKKFWTVLDFLQKPLAWLSKFYLRIQSKNCGKNSLFFFPFRIFFEFCANIFQTFGQKTSISFQNYLLRVQRNSLWLEIFFKNFESFQIFCRNLWHGS